MGSVLSSFFLFVCEMLIVALLLWCCWMNNFVWKAVGWSDLRRRIWGDFVGFDLGDWLCLKRIGDFWCLRVISG